MLEVKNLTKYFLKPIPFHQKMRYCCSRECRPKNIVLSNINFAIKEGEIVGLFGRNGAGKTTLLKVISNIVLPDQGRILIEGRSHFSNLQKVGLVLNNDRSFYWRLTSYDNLMFFGRLHGLTVGQIKEAIEQIDGILDLKEILQKRFDMLSSGMKQKINLARALLVRPKILLLDEPTINLDIVYQQRFLDYINELKANFGLTIFWASHHLEEIESICKKTFILDAGKIVWKGTIENFTKNFYEYRYITTAKDSLGKSKEIIFTNLSQAINSDVNFLESIISKRSFMWERIKPIQESDANILSENISNEKTVVDRMNVSVLYLFSRCITNLLCKIKRLQLLCFLFLKKDFQIERGYKFSFFLDIVGILFSALSFYFISRLFEGNTQNFNIPTENYFSFVLIGLAFMGFINTSLSGFSANLRQAQTMGIIEQIIISPISVFEYLFSSNIYFFLLSGFRFAVYLLIGLLLGLNISFYPLGLLWAAVLFLLSMGIFSSLGIISSAFIMILKKGDPINFFMGGLMGLLGGVYYPAAILPSFLRFIAHLVPLLYALEGIRICLFSFRSSLEIVPYIKTLFLFFIILFPLSIFLYKWALIKAKKEGTISFY